ncbi:type II toxin-antitoxin system RelE/ParE family toxin [Candidatus Micrarchaeota archaeon]|nr:type II toxin-antitoxin system RelE/ParE family toxin [Candidatus Micrarchaeota archaeon]
MAYEIRWDEKAREFLRKIQFEDAQRIIRKVNGIADFPEHYLGSLVEVKAYKLRVGDYRAIIDLDKNNKIISVLFIGHRKNIYDKF